MAEIDEALARIDAGTYGTCAVCGRVIPEERLAAVPYATLCLDDKRRRSKGERAAPHRSAAAIDVRVGSATNALQPISSAERTLGAGPAQWVSLAVVAAPRWSPTS